MNKNIFKTKSKYIHLHNTKIRA